MRQTNLIAAGVSVVALVVALALIAIQSSLGNALVSFAVIGTAAIIGVAIGRRRAGRG